ncbi:MAG: hypothetical protein KA072_14310, partial [Thermoanaerobaculaceae bacterium]|nr:hypothetical protein [Thermoanaerobaculaceae bacterium]MDI9622872.1 hypothetical protein [Acidobacteriota bacterium]
VLRANDSPRCARRPAVDAAVAAGVREDLPLRVQVSHSAVDGASRRPQPLGTRCACPTAPTASATMRDRLL